MKLNTATKSFECDFFVYNGTDLYANLPGADLMTVASVFGNPAEVARVSHGVDTLNGYTKLGNLSINDDGSIQVNMRK